MFTWTLPVLRFNMDDLFKTVLGTTCNDDFSGKIELGVKEILHGTIFNTTFQTRANIVAGFWIAFKKPTTRCRNEVLCLKSPCVPFYTVLIFTVAMLGFSIESKRCTNVSACYFLIDSGVFKGSLPRIFFVLLQPLPIVRLARCTAIIIRGKG